MIFEASVTKWSKVNVLWLWTHLYFNTTLMYLSVCKCDYPELISFNTINEFPYKEIHLFRVKN